MPIRTLSTDLVPLVHHIELAKAGWGARLTEQLVTAVSYAAGAPMSLVELRQAIEQLCGVRPSDADIKRAVGTWTSKKALLEITPGQFRLSESHRSELDRQREDTASLEAAAEAAFSALLEKHGIKDASTWDDFKIHCLRPMVSDIGARIYHVLSGDPPTAQQQKHVDAYVEKCAPEKRHELTSAADEFIRYGPPPARKYILQHLHAHLLISAASLPAPTLDKLQARLKSTTKLTLIVDTNVLFSLLDLHENPGNDPSCDLVKLAALLKGKLNISFAVLPVTLDEAKRTLLYYKQKLSRMDLTSLVGRVALRSDERLSGITQRFFQKAGQGTARITADAYFEPYLDDLISVAKERGVSLFNESAAKLGTRQDVVDDILGQQEREKRRGESAKPYEAIHHDIVLWHCVNDRRNGVQQGPLDASHWLVTLDFGLLGFDSFKHRDRATYVPVCVHPTVLVQLLQLWLPRDQRVDEAMINSLRPLLPHDFDPDAEEVTLKIVSSLSRYENVDDLGEDTISEILMNQALRQRMRAEQDVERQTKLVRDAIVEQVEFAREELKRTVVEKEAVAAALEAERISRGQLAGDLSNERATAETQKQRALEAAATTQELRARVSQLESEVQRGVELQKQSELKRARNRFVVKSVGVLGVGLLVAGGLGYFLAPVVGLSRVRLALGSAVVWTAVWLQVTHWWGGRSLEVREWSPFVRFGHCRGWLWATGGAILLGIVTTRIDEVLKRIGW